MRIGPPRHFAVVGRFSRCARRGLVGLRGGHAARCNRRGGLGAEQLHSVVGAGALLIARATNRFAVVGGIADACESGVREATVVAVQIVLARAVALAFYALGVNVVHARNAESVGFTS